MKKALLVIDMQNDYLYEKRKPRFAYRTEELTAAVNALIRQGYRVYFLSNWNRRNYELLMESGLLRFTERMKGGVWSFREHCIKPNPEIFHILISRYGIDPQRAIFIDDSEKNVKGARDVGFAALRFTSYPDAQEELGKLGIRWNM